MSKPSKLKGVIRDLRRGLNYSGLYEKDAADDPIQQFEVWLNEAVKKETFEPNAMTLATATSDGKPTARTVLLKDFGPEGFEFYTNYNSRKGQSLEENPQASLVFYWGSLSRQVLIDGTVTKLSHEKSAEYFHSRPRASQIAAYISNQSHAVANRNELKALMKSASEKFRDQEVPCPEHWGGFVLMPTRIEFWQGRPDRLHDRLCYTREESNQWRRQRLAP